VVDMRGNVTSRATLEEDPARCDHGAWDGPTVADAPHEAVKGGISSVASTVGSGLRAGMTAAVRAGSTLTRAGMAPLRARRH
jgi:hypothetical protein